MHVDAHKGPLDCPYCGPFRIICFDAKMVVIDINGREDTVSIDQIKPTVIPVSNKYSPFSLSALCSGPCDVTANTGSASSLSSFSGHCDVDGSVYRLVLDPVSAYPPALLFLVWFQWAVTPPWSMLDADPQLTGQVP